MSNLDKVMYPLTGFTKAQVIDYYVRVAPVMLAHIGDRGITLRRWPDGVTGESFFEKRCPKHRPGWVGTCAGPGDRGGSIMKRSLRPNKVFIDWGQNARFKTTVAPYSLRGRDRPTASTPITWDELSDGADGEPLTFTAAEVLERVDELGDLFAPTLTVEQDLPTPSPSG